MNRQQTVLIVDDEKSNRDRLTELLQPDCRIILAKNGQQALERVADQAPDLILLDVMMPDMDGHQVIQILKHDDNTRKIPVFFISEFLFSGVSGFKLRSPEANFSLCCR